MLQICKRADLIDAQAQNLQVWHALQHANVLQVVAAKVEVPDQVHPIALRSMNTISSVSVLDRTIAGQAVLSPMSEPPSTPGSLL
eukprot:CAMPEP_0172660304 /NCGR_PEP_ID=MMETSP1074-20121228/3992_1 /TAXON_ID=2916 /ORGANISM="Ceratium fusus, Strain PA161109" /LENGTH=84 /DNA_ID=CAMNT_0013475911 /DNA_START=1236 /DNA_END=1488 /DNA_ORIENTATION=+